MKTRIVIIGASSALADQLADSLDAELVSLANEETPQQLVPMAPMANALELDADGWALLAPYGDWPVRLDGRTVTQRFHRAAANSLVSNFRSIAGRIKRAIVGLPIYKGHPDNPEFARLHTDFTKMGNVAGFDAREDGLYWRPVLNDEGADLVESGYEFGSIHWLCQPLGNDVFEPVIAKSVGLTDTPNLPNQSLSNASPEAQQDNTNTKDNTMPTWLLELLGLAPDATEDDVKQALAALKDKAAAASGSQDAPAEMANQLATAQADLETAKADLNKARQDLANERKSVREALVANALEEKRILAADKDTWLNRLERDFENESKALANAQPIFDSTRRSSSTRPGAQSSDRQQQIESAVRKRMRETGEKWPTAFANCKADPATAALFKH